MQWGSASTQPSYLEAFRGDRTELPYQHFYRFCFAQTTPPSSFLGQKIFGKALSGKLAWVHGSHSCSGIYLEIFEVNKSPINILTRNLKGGSAAQQRAGHWSLEPLAFLFLTLNCSLTYNICVSQGSALVSRITITKSFEEILLWCVLGIKKRINLVQSNSKTLDDNLCVLLHPFATP